MNPDSSIYVYYSLIDPDMADERFFGYLNQLPSSLHADILKYHRRADQVRTLTGKLLMQEAIVQAGFDAAHMDAILYTSFKRPYIAEHFDFNITHSGNCVACCAGFDVRLGIDVEEIHSITPDDILAVLRDEELEEMRRTNASAETILHFWTRKEAIVKASGEGLYMQPQEIYFVDELTARAGGIVWHLHKLDVGQGYICYCVSSLPGRQIVMKEMKY